MKTLIALGAALLAWPALALAQQAPPATTTTGSFTGGTRQVDTDTHSSKFTEYRDYRDRALANATFSTFDAATGRHFDFTGSSIGLKDQSIAVRGGRTNAWTASFDFSGVPHNYSNKAQTPYISRTAGLFEVPANVPITFKKLATAAADTPGVLASDALIAAYQRAFLASTPLEIQTWFGRGALRYTGVEAFDFGLVYDIQKKSGTRATYGPIGDRPPRTLNIQIAEPVDHRTQDITLSAAHTGRRVQVQGSYQFSDFANQVDTLTWENVFAAQLGDQTYDNTWDRSVSTFGRRPLSPDNRYHNASVTVGGNLPLESRLSATAAYGRFEQNETLLPYSYNSDILAVQTLPRSTAEGLITTTQLLVDYVVNPWSLGGLRAWVRHYGMDNETPQDRWEYVTSDTANLNGTASFKNRRLNRPFATDRTNAGAEATFRARGSRSSFTLGYELEDLQREFREADTQEHRLTAAARLRAGGRANLRVRYLFGVRDGDYDPFVARQSYWYEVGTDRDNPRFTFDNHPDMRRYDISDRRRHQADVTLTLTPADALSVSASARYRSDDFDSDVTAVQPLVDNPTGERGATTPGIQLGRLDDARQRYAVDLFYAPSDRSSFNTFVSWDKGTSLQRGLEFNENNKENPSAVATAELGPWTRGSSAWTADTDDRTLTAGLGGTFTVVPDRLLLTPTYSLSLSQLDIAYGGFGVTNWNGTPFPLNHQFAFTTPPAVTTDLHAFDLRAEIPVARTLAFIVGYGYERYRIDDWQQSGAEAWVEGVGSEFLLRDTSRSFQWGNRLFNLGTYLAPDYDGHIGYASVRYRF